jgi:D-sedoheptulose 7-phosphate isomerase
MTHPVDQYLLEQLQVIAQTPRDRIPGILALLERARDEKRHIFLFGNGGSGSTASHFACDLGKSTIRADKPRFKVIALHDNFPTFSAYANDHGYERVFAEPLITLAEPGDLAIGFSGSGNSPYVLRALEAANGRGLSTIGFSGFEGGALKNLSQISLVVPSDVMGQIEDVHLMLTHALCNALTIKHE